MNHKYTEEEIADVKEREAKALAFLKELYLTPAAVVTKINLGIEGKDIFADQVQAYLADFKFLEKQAVVSDNPEVNPNLKNESN